MKIRLVETGLGRFRAGNSELYIVIKRHAEDRLAERLPDLDLQDVKETIELAINEFADPDSGKVERGQYLIINEFNHLMVPLMVAQNQTKGYENQDIGIVPTIMDYGARYMYPAGILDKYNHDGEVTLGVDEGVLVESTNIPFGFTVNGEPCKWIMFG